MDVTLVDVVAVVALILEIGVGAETITVFVVLVELLVIETWLWLVVGSFCLTAAAWSASCF